MHAKTSNGATYTPSQLVYELGMPTIAGPTTLARWRARGMGPPWVRRGNGRGRIYYDREAVAAWLAGGSRDHRTKARRALSGRPTAAKPRHPATRAPRGKAGSAQQREAPAL